MVWHFVYPRRCCHPPARDTKKNNNKINRNIRQGRVMPLGRTKNKLSNCSTTHTHIQSAHAPHTIEKNPSLSVSIWQWKPFVPSAAYSPKAWHPNNRYFGAGFCFVFTTTACSGIEHAMRQRATLCTRPLCPSYHFLNRFSTIFHTHTHTQRTNGASTRIMRSVCWSLCSVCVCRWRHWYHVACASHKWAIAKRLMRLQHTRRTPP